MWTRLFSLLPLLANILVLQLDYNNATVFKYTNAVCESYNETLFVIHQCRLKAVKRDMVIFNMNSTLFYPLNSAFAFHGQVFKRANGYKPWLFNIDVDICAFLRRPYNPAAIILYKLMKEFTNMNHTCPFVGSLIVKDLYLRPEVLRLPLPTGDYMINTTYSHKGVPQAGFRLYWSYVEDLSVRD